MKSFLRMLLAYPCLLAAFIIAPSFMTTWANASAWSILTLCGLVTDAVTVPLGLFFPSSAKVVEDFAHGVLGGYQYMISHGLSLTDKVVQTTPPTPAPTGFWSSRMYSLTASMSFVAVQMSHPVAFIGWMIRLLVEGSLLVAEAWWALKLIWWAIWRMILFPLGFRRWSLGQSLLTHSQLLRWCHEQYVWVRFGDEAEYQSWLQKK